MISQETRDKRSASMRAYWANRDNRARLTEAVIAVTPDAWSHCEDRRLLNLKDTGFPDRSIAEKMGRTCVAVRSRLKTLRKRGRAG
jgi:hypothetical protein